MSVKLSSFNEKNLDVLDKKMSETWTPEPRKIRSLRFAVASPRCFLRLHRLFFARRCLSLSQASFTFSRASARRNPSEKTEVAQPSRACFAVELSYRAFSKRVISNSEKKGVREHMKTLTKLFFKRGERSKKMPKEAEEQIYWPS